MSAESTLKAAFADARGLFDETVAVLKAHPIPFVLPPVLLALVIGGGSSLGFAGTRGNSYDLTLLWNDPALLFTVLAGGALMLLLGILLLALTGIVWLVLADATLHTVRDATAPDVATSFHRSKPHFIGAALTMVVFVVLYVLGLLLLLVPGVFVLAALVAWPTVLAAEGHSGIAGFKRAWTLAKPRWLALMMLTFAGVLTMLVVGAVLSALPIVGSGLSAIVEGVLVAGYITLGVIVYVQSTRRADVVA